MSWPAGWPRTPPAQVTDGKHQFRRPLTSRASPFWTFADARDALYDELRRLGAGNVVISSNFRPDRDGRPVEQSRRPIDQGIAVYFVVGERTKVMARDHFQRAEENMRSLALTIEALRAIERHGGGMMLDRAFEGFAALPPPIAMGSARPWFEVLGVAADARADQIKAAYRIKARKIHPDAGGTAEQMAELNRARDEGLARTL